MFVCCECCVLSGRCLFDGMITRPDEFYLVWGVVVCDIENSWMKRPRSNGGCRAKNKTKKLNIVCTCQDAKLNLSKQITVRWEFNKFGEQFDFLNVSGTLVVSSSGCLCANIRNAFVLVQCVRHRCTSKFLRRSVNTHKSWAFGCPLTYGRRLWSPLLTSLLHGAESFLRS